MGDLLVTMAQFILKINLGNAAMQDISDIQGVLKNVVNVLSGISNIHDARMQGKYRLHDVNGNVVGSWQVK